MRIIQSIFALAGVLIFACHLNALADDEPKAQLFLSADAAAVLGKDAQTIATALRDSLGMKDSVTKTLQSQRELQDSLTLDPGRTTLELALDSEYTLLDPTQRNDDWAAKYGRTFDSYYLAIQNRSNPDALLNLSTATIHATSPFLITFYHRAIEECLLQKSREGHASFVLDSDPECLPQRVQVALLGVIPDYDRTIGADVVHSLRQLGWQNPWPSQYFPANWSGERAFTNCLATFQFSVAEVQSARAKSWIQRASDVSDDGSASDGTNSDPGKVRVIVHRDRLVLLGQKETVSALRQNLGDQLYDRSIDIVYGDPDKDEKNISKLKSLRLTFALLTDDPASRQRAADAQYELARLRWKRLDTTWPIKRIADAVEKGTLSEEQLRNINQVARSYKDYISTVESDNTGIDQYVALYNMARLEYFEHQHYLHRSDSVDSKLHLEAAQKLCKQLGPITRCTGGDECSRLREYDDFDSLHDNAKRFCGEISGVS